MDTLSDFPSKKILKTLQNFIISRFFIIKKKGKNLIYRTGPFACKKADLIARDASILCRDDSCDCVCKAEKIASSNLGVMEHRGWDS